MYGKFYLLHPWFVLEFLLFWINIVYEYNQDRRMYTFKVLIVLNDCMFSPITDM